MAEFVQHHKCWRRPVGGRGGTVAGVVVEVLASARWLGQRLVLRRWAAHTRAGRMLAWSSARKSAEAAVEGDQGEEVVAAAQCSGRDLVLALGGVGGDVRARFRPDLGLSGLGWWCTGPSGSRLA
jgi:hypothetical protein